MGSGVPQTRESTSSFCRRPVTCRFPKPAACMRRKHPSLALHMTSKSLEAWGWQSLFPGRRYGCVQTWERQMPTSTRHAGRMLNSDASPSTWPPATTSRSILM